MQEVATSCQIQRSQSKLTNSSERASSTWPIGNHSFGQPFIEFSRVEIMSKTINKQQQVRRLGGRPTGGEQVEDQVEQVVLVLVAC